jgi:hypothetical protein
MLIDGLFFDFVAGKELDMALDLIGNQAIETVRIWQYITRVIPSVFQRSRPKNQSKRLFCCAQRNRPGGANYFSWHAFLTGQFRDFRVRETERLNVRRKATGVGVCLDDCARSTQGFSHQRRGLETDAPRCTDVHLAATWAHCATDEAC